MLEAVVKRTQYAVGHGGFHAGNISVRESAGPYDHGSSRHPIDNFRYVYDCGSEHRDAFNAALRSYSRECDGKTDLLFVSHLHSDHINGIERLQTMAPAETVVVPYLDVVARLVFILSDFDEGSISSSALEYFQDPVDWWQRRNAKRVIFLQPGGINDLPPSPPAAPDAPGDEDGPAAEMGDTSGEEKTPQAKLAEHLRMPKGDIPDGLRPASGTQQDSADGGILAGPGSSFQLRWRANSFDTWRIGDWILLPYVHPADVEARSKFFSALKKALKLRDNDESKLSQRLVDYLASREKIKVLLDVYADHFGRNQNALSMSLYSGPFCASHPLAGSGAEWGQYWYVFPEPSLPYSAFGYNFDEPVGWLGTGDAALRQTIRRGPWLNFFKPYARKIGVLTLPHHGSAHNFHEELLSFGALKVALATTVGSRNKVARLRETLAVVDAHRISSQVVDDDDDYSFELCCRRNLCP
ncbi:MAG TPA: MBL fold metallo-hydrolase [Rhizobiaceae bacterium]|nr:MBL fold metallo-hydrolase [Rhizobiaceae bacterium]